MGSASPAWRSFGGASRPCHVARVGALATFAVRLSHAAPRHLRGELSRARRLSHHSLFGASGACAPHRRGTRRARAELRLARPRYSYCAQRQPAPVSQRTVLGRSLARARAHHATSRSARSRLRARQLSQAPAGEQSGARPLLLRSVLRALRRAFGGPHSLRPRARTARAGARRRQSSHAPSRNLALAHGVASARAREPLRETALHALSPTSAPLEMR